MRLDAVFAAVIDRLRAIPVIGPRAEAEVLLTTLLGVRRTDLFVAGERRIAPADLHRINVCLARRAAREPLAYILGETEFYGLRFSVNPSVLIPRQETELIVEEALVRLQQIPGEPMVADIGTGSGCIAISIAAHCPRAVVYATEISPEALETARQNSRRHGVEPRLRFVLSDMLETFVADGTPLDVIVCNPPYVTDDEYTRSMPENTFEPQVALTAGDGLRYYRRLACSLGAVLRPGGCLVLELHPGHADRIEALFTERGFAVDRRIPDYPGASWGTVIVYPGAARQSWIP